jgi:hypothetical protein
MTEGASGPAGEPAVELDPVVRTALKLLPIPDHDDDFWLRLEAALDAEAPHVPAPLERVRRVPVSDAAWAIDDAPVRALELDSALAIVPPAFRRRSNALLAMVAAAAIVVVAVAGNTLRDDRQGTAVREPEADAALETLVRNAQADSGTVTTLSSARADASSEAVLAWVDDVGAGDVDAAWDAMGEVSQAHFDSQAEFEDLMTDLAEGYGAWSAAEPDDVLVTPVAAGDDGTVAVVTLLGTVEHEGTSQVRADAFPVRIVDGDIVLEPFASAGDMEVVIPEPTSDDGLSWESIGTGEELVFVLPASVEAPVLQLDSGDTVVCGEAEGTEWSDLDQSDGQRCAYLPEGGFEVGRHTVTIAFLGTGGDSITAESIPFVAA